MDTLTHALSGALLARSGLVKQSEVPLRVQLTVGFLAAASPDLDFVSRFFGPLTYLQYHRSLTHSLILLPFWALLLGWLFRKLFHSRHDLKPLLLISAAALAIHITGDLITAYGTMIFAPISWAKFSWPNTFIIDLWLSGTLLATLILSLIFRQQGRHIALAGLTLLALYIGYQGTLRWQAEAIGEQQAQALHLKDYEVYAHPQPLSPYHWKVFIKVPDRYHIAYVNLKARNALPSASDEASLFERIRAIYRPIDQLSWYNHNRLGRPEQQALAAEAWSQPAMAPLRDFMMFPTVFDVDQGAQQTCVWFRDERFTLDGVRDGPFLFGSCRHATGIWHPYRLRDGVKQPL
jgi:inner membrane protein